MPAVTVPARVSGSHQALLRIVGEGCGSDAAMLAKVRKMVLPEIERHDEIKTWIIDGEPDIAHGWEPFARQCAAHPDRESCLPTSVARSTAFPAQGNSIHQAMS